MSLPQSNHYLIDCDRVFNSQSGKTEARRIEVHNGKFQRIDELSQLGSPPPGLEHFDLRGFTLLPLLMDTHVHLYLNPWPLEPESRSAPGTRQRVEEQRAATRRMRQALRAGVGTLRDLGDPLDINLEAVRSSEHSRDLPRILSSGPAVHRNGRYGRILGHAFDDKPSLLRAVNALTEHPQVSVIKLVPTGIINFKKGCVSAAPSMDLDEMRAVVELAHESGKPVAAHCSGEAGLRLAIAAGIDFIEHGYFINRELIEQLAAKQLHWTPTFAPLHIQWKFASQCGWDADTRTTLRKILDDHADSVRYAHSIGVKLLAGSDAGAQGVTHGGGLWLELALLHEAGLSVASCLQIATARASQSLGLQNETGQIAQGFAADFIVVDGPPEAPFSDCSAIRWVAREGEFLSDAPLHDVPVQAAMDERIETRGDSGFSFANN